MQFNRRSRGVTTGRDCQLYIYWVGSSRREDFCFFSFLFFFLFVRFVRRSPSSGDFLDFLAERRKRMRAILKYVSFHGDRETPLSS